MKKLTFILLAVAGSMAFVNCSSDDDEKVVAVDCYELAQDVMDAASAYTADNTDANCIAYKNALQAAIDAECAGSSTFQGVIDALPCN